MNAIQKNDQLELRDWTNTHLYGGQFDAHRTLALFEKVVKGAKAKETSSWISCEPHPLVIIGGILQENPFFIPPEEC